MSTDTGTSPAIQGQLTIKVQLYNDIRKFQLNAEDLTFDDLVDMIEKVFDGKVTRGDPISIKYMDQDGDFVTMSGHEDFSFALNTGSGLLRLTICKTMPAMDDNLVNMDIRHLKAILKNLFDRVEKVMDILEERADVQEVKNVQPLTIPVDSSNTVVTNGLLAPTMAAPPPSGSPYSSYGPYYHSPAAHDHHVLNSGSLRSPLGANRNVATGHSGISPPWYVQPVRTGPTVGRMQPDQFPYMALSEEDERLIRRQLPSGAGLELRFITRSPPSASRNLTSSPE